MKKFKYIKSSEYIQSPALNEIENEAYHAGYDLIADNFDILSLVSRKPDKVLPVLTVETSQIAEEIQYEVEIEFPNIDSRDFVRRDELENLVDDWQAVAKLVTKILQTRIDPSDWEDVQ